MHVDTKRNLINKLGILIPIKSKWLEYHENMITFFDARFLSDVEKKEICIGALGAKAVKLLKSLVKPRHVKDVDYNTIIETLDEHFYPVKDRLYYITKFQLRKQYISESFFDYLVALRDLIQHCGFGKSSTARLRNHLIENVHIQLKSRLKEKGSCTLSKIFCEGVKLTITRDSRLKKKKWKEKCFRCSLPLAKYHENIQCPFDIAKCESCEIKGHLAIACKYKNVICNNCKNVGHIAKICKAQKKVENNGTRYDPDKWISTQARNYFY